MGKLQNENWEAIDVEAIEEAIQGNGVISGLAVTESSTPAMTVAVSAGQCVIDGVVYAEASSQNLTIDNGDVTNARKDIIVYDATASNPAVVKGTPAAAPVPADIPAGDILLGIVFVEANESTAIFNADITDDRFYSVQRWAYTSVSVNTTLNDAYQVVGVDATGGVRTITLPTAVGIRGKIYVVKKIDSSTNVVTVDGDGSETIDGATTALLSAQYSALMIQSDGTNWMQITTDKTDNEIRDAVEAATDSNTFTDADHTKLNGVESGSTKYPDTGEQAFLDADHTKLDGITALADVTGSNAPQAHKASHASGGSDEMRIQEYVISNDTLFANDAEVYVNYNTVLIKKMETVLTTTPASTVRIQYKANVNYNHSTIGSRLYKNGVAFGVLHTSVPAGWTTYSEDLPVADGDLIQIYLRSSTSNSVYAKELRILGKMVEIIDPEIVASNQNP